MKEKRSQQEIITTVLLVLIALAAIALIATFVMRNIREGAETGESQISCLKVNYEITQALNNQSNISVRRNTGGEDIEVESIRIFLNGKWTSDITSANLPKALETVSVCAVSNCTSGKLAAKDKIEIAPVLKGGAICEIKDTETVTAA